MEDPKEKNLEKDREVIEPGRETREEGELAENDLDKVAGGSGDLGPDNVQKKHVAG
jgi:hypothetical protein